MIRKLIAAHRQRKADRVALETYRRLIGQYDRWFASFPDICMVLDNMRGLAESDPRGRATLRDVLELRIRVKTMRMRELSDYLQDNGH